MVGLDMLFPMRPPPEGLCGSVAGRSPGLRVLTRHRLPGLCPVALWFGLAAHSCGGSRGFGYYLTAFPFFVPPNAGTDDRGTIARKTGTARSAHGDSVAGATRPSEAKRGRVIGIKVTIMGKLSAAIGTAVFLFLAPGVVAGVIPWWMSHWHWRDAPFGFAAVRVLGI